MPVDIVRDLRAAFGEVRDQGCPTCIAFATSDVHAAVRVQPFEPLSVEHLYWHAVQRTPGGRPEDGVSLPAILEALDQDGQSLETGWPYLKMLPSDLAAWLPPASAAPAFRRGTQRGAGVASRVVAALGAGRASLLTLRLGLSFFTPVAGMVVPDAYDVDVAYHAIVAVAHGVGADGGPFVLIRNSWGPSWGVDGHAWLPEAYLDARAIGLALMNGPEIA